MTAIALIALAVSAGTQTAQAHGQAEKEYIESLFAIAWFENGQLPRQGRHKLYLMHWKETAYADDNFAELPIAGRYVHVFNESKKSIGRIIYGELKLTDDEGNKFHQAIGDPAFDPHNERPNAKRTFYLQLINLDGFNPATAMKLEVFPNRKIAKITLHNGFRRLVPLQKYASTTSATQHKKTTANRNQLRTNQVVLPHQTRRRRRAR